MKPSYRAAKEVLLDRELLFTLADHSSKKQQVTEIFEILRDPVYRYMFRVLENEHEAEDFTQEVFLRLYTCLHQGQSVGNVRAWVFRVAHNLVIDRQKRKLVLSQTDMAPWDQMRDPTPGAEELLLEEEQNKRLREAIAQLSPSEKECLELRAEGLSYQEMADILGMRLSTLVKFVGRVIKKLVKEVNHD